MTFLYNYHKTQSINKNKKIVNYMFKSPIIIQSTTISTNLHIQLDNSSFGIKINDIQI